MKTPMRLAFALALLAVTGPAMAVPGGEIDVLRRGDFRCELPGDAEGPVGQAMPDESFSVLNDSSYSTAAGQGTYLLTGDRVVMTTGPQRGIQYHRITSRFIRRIGADGNDTNLRCVFTAPRNP